MGHKGVVLILEENTLYFAVSCKEFIEGLDVVHLDIGSNEAVKSCQFSKGGFMREEEGLPDFASGNVKGSKKR
jgi:hypothetical protein